VTVKFELEAGVEGAFLNVRLSSRECAASLIAMQQQHFLLYGTKFHIESNSLYIDYKLCGCFMQ
jgi:hypothetical protein